VIMSQENPHSELEAIIHNQVKAAMSDWAKTGLFTKENMTLFWASAFDVLQDKAQEHTGKFVVTSISSIIKKLFVFVLLGTLVYAAGGWSAFVGFLKSFFTSGGH